MPQTRVVFYQETDGEVPVLEWLMQLVKQNRKGDRLLRRSHPTTCRQWIRVASSGGRLPK